MTSERMDLVVQPCHQPLRGSVPVPSDKSIGHRSLLVGSLCAGESEVREFSYGEDNVATLHAMRAMGVRIDDDEKGTLRIYGRGLYGLSVPSTPLDCGNSGTTMRLLAGILCAQSFQSILVGDASLTRRPMARIALPLRRRGAAIEGAPHASKVGEITAPLVIGPLRSGARLLGCEEVLSVPSAQVKSALLLSGLYAEGNTYVQEPLVSRDHTERLLRALGAPLRAVATMVELNVQGWSAALPAFSLAVPGDLSAAAFLLVASQLIPGSEVIVRHCGVNPTRSGVLDILRARGASVVVESKGDEMGEPVADLHAAAPASGLQAGLVAGELCTRAIDEIPIVCALAARSQGVTEIADAAELRVKESDRIAAMARVLRAFGVAHEERPDGLRIEGQPGSPLRAADVDSEGDHRIAMAAAVLGLVAQGETRIRNVSCVATSFPKFAGTLRALGADVRVVNAIE